MSLEILQNSQENTCARASFLHTLDFYRTLFYRTANESQIELLLVGLLTKAYEKYQAKNLFSNLYSTLFKTLRVGNYYLHQGRNSRSYMIHRADLRIFETFEKTKRRKDKSWTPLHRCSWKFRRIFRAVFLIATPYCCFCQATACYKGLKCFKMSLRITELTTKVD